MRFVEVIIGDCGGLSDGGKLPVKASWEVVKGWVAGGVEREEVGVVL